MDDAWYQEVAIRNLAQVQRFNRLMDQAKTDIENSTSVQSNLDIADPRNVEKLVYAALCMLGYDELVADLRRTGRPKKGRFSRNEALSFMKASPQFCLQFAYQLLPKTRKARAKKKRVSGNVWPHYDLTRVIFFLETHENLSVAEAIRRCKAQLDLPHDEKDLHTIYSKNIFDVVNRKKSKVFVID